MHCMWCHTAVPHGWKNKALLVNLNDVGAEAGLPPNTEIASNASADVYNQEPYYFNAKLKVRTFAQSGNWEDTNCGSAGSQYSGQQYHQRQRLDEGRMFESTLNLLRTLASLKLTLLGIVALLAGVLLAYFSQDRSSAWIIIPLVILAVNLLAAILFNPRIRQNSGLLMFHICLLMIAIISLLSQLTSMKGRVEVTQGAAFDAGSVTLTEQGAWHSFSSLQQVEFVQGDIRGGIHSRPQAWTDPFTAAAQCRRYDRCR